MPAKIVWNDDLDAALHRVYTEVPRQHDRAEIMGICLPVLRRRARELGIRHCGQPVPAKPLPISRWAVDLYREGHTRREIADLTGLTRNAVTGVLWRAKQRGDLPRG